MNTGDEFSKYAATAIVSLIGGLLGWRGFSKVRSDIGKDARESRFEENLQTRYEAAQGRISELQLEIDALKAKLSECDKRLTVVQMIADGDPARAVEISRDSAFVDLTRPLRPRQRGGPSSSMDPFQAADPYAPKPPPKKKG